VFLIWGYHLRYSRTPRTNSFSKYIVKKLTFFSNFHQTVKANCCAFAATGCRKSYPLLQSSASLKNAGKHCYAARYCTLRISMICLLQSRSRRVSLPFPPPRGYHEALRGFETVPWRGRSIVIADNRALFRNLRTLSSIYPSRYVKVRALIASRAADDAPSALNDI